MVAYLLSVAPCASPRLRSAVRTFAERAKLTGYATVDALIRAPIDAVVAVWRSVRREHRGHRNLRSVLLRALRGDARQFPHDYPSRQRRMRPQRGTMTAAQCALFDAVQNLCGRARWRSSEERCLRAMVATGVLRSLADLAEWDRETVDANVDRGATLGGVGRAYCGAVRLALHNCKMQLGAPRGCGRRAATAAA